MFRKLKEDIVELIFPSHCASCERIGNFLCKDCQDLIIRIKDDSCPQCNAISNKGRYCPRCRKKVFLTGVISVGYLKDEVLKTVIHTYKYDRISGLSLVLSDMLLEKIKKSNLSFDKVFYVPITRKREAWRGFNQAELLAKELARELDLPLGIMKKAKDTKTQVGLPKKEREKNLKDAFRLVKSFKLEGQKILLIDDVITTGTTLNECAKVLKQNGAKVVYGAVLAKE